MDLIIYHNPDCETSRNTLAMIRNAGVEPHVIEYLKTPPTRTLLKQLIERMGISVCALLRQKGTPYAELGLGDPSLTDDQLLDAMLAHPILLPPQLGEFSKEDGQRVIDEHGRRVATA